MFAAHLDGGCNIKDHLVFLVFIFLVSDGSIYKGLNFAKLLLFYKAIQQKGGVVFGVVGSGTAVTIGFAFWLFSQFSEVFYQVIQLWHLDKLLDNVTGIEMTDGLDVLVDCLYIVLFFVKFVAKFFVDL